MHMIKIAVFAGLIGCIQFCNAQINAGNPEERTFHVFEGGFSAGFNASQVDGDSAGGFNRLGFNAGPLLHVNFSPQWFVSLEILFNQKGSRSTDADNLPYVYRLRMNYAEVPVLINFNDKNRLIFQAGAAYGRLFSVQALFNGFDVENDDDFFNDEISYILGGSILVGEKKHFGVNVRYQGSITAVGKSATTGLVNRLISFRGVYYF